MALVEQRDDPFFQLGDHGRQLLALTISRPRRRLSTLTTGRPSVRFASSSSSKSFAGLQNSVGLVCADLGKARAHLDPGADRLRLRVLFVQLGAAHFDVVEKLRAYSSGWELILGSDR